MFFSCDGGGGSVCLGALLDYYYFPEGWVRELHMMRDAHLLFCSFTQATLEQAGGEKLCSYFLVPCSVGRLSMG
jgi:hypothetical protein